MAKTRRLVAKEAKEPKRDRKTKPRKPAPLRKAALPAKPPAPKRGVYDLGGLPAGKINRDQHTLTPFEERVDALMMLLTNQQGIYKVDALRRAIESLDGHDYKNLAYYEKWIRGIRMMLVEQGVVTDTEIDGKIAEIKARLARGSAA